MPPFPDAPPPYRSIAFDADSTLSALEGIDELAGPLRQEIEELTRRAMRGELPLEAVYGQRLARIRPSRAAVEALGARYVERIVPGARELVAALRFLGKRVAIVSGGIRPALLALGRELGLPEQAVHGVELDFDAAGAYAGFDPSAPLARSGGKREIVERLAREPGALPLALVGDGITDLEAAGDGAAARFVAFGGVVRRAEVFARAAVRCERPDLAALLPLLLSEREISILGRSREHQGLLARARDPSPPSVS